MKNTLNATRQEVRSDNGNPAAVVLDALEAALRAHREEHFKATYVDSDKYHPGEKTLNVTWNGSQTYSWGFLPVEAQKVAALLCPELETLRSIAKLACAAFGELEDGELKDRLSDALAGLAGETE